MAIKIGLKSLMRHCVRERERERDQFVSHTSVCWCCTQLSILNGRMHYIVHFQRMLSSSVVFCVTILILYGHNLEYINHSAHTHISLTDCVKWMSLLFFMCFGLFGALTSAEMPISRVYLSFYFGETNANIHIIYFNILIKIQTQNVSNKANFMLLLSFQPHQ